MQFFFRFGTSMKQSISFLEQREMFCQRLQDLKALFLMA